MAGNTSNKIDSLIKTFVPNSPEQIYNWCLNLTGAEENIREIWGLNETELTELEVNLLLLTAKKDTQGPIGYEALEDAFAAVKVSHPEYVKNNLLKSAIWLTEEKQKDFIPQESAAKIVPNEQVALWQKTYLPLLENIGDLLAIRGDTALSDACYEFGLTKTDNDNSYHRKFKDKLEH